ncbi:MAG: hypothetical protein D6798_15835 [Deltaproteobacteria bacterium]|nr:MAG: hypothetical protein D6798_15835 [Deltaproteobacteria bacterium]
MPRLTTLVLSLLLAGCSKDRDGDGYDQDIDCNDEDPEVHPDAVERCNEVDDDCNGEIDDGAGAVWYLDADADGYGVEDEVALACGQPAGFALNGEDCDDADDRISPAADELCDGIDNDCDGLIDDEDDDTLYDPTNLWYGDGDGDGYGSPDKAVLACEAPDDYVDNNDDCDDDLATVNPAAVEVCDGIDNNCADGADESTAVDATSWYYDGDGDGFGVSDSLTDSCTRPADYTDVPDDCNDKLDTVNPAAEELCNDGVDNDCDDIVSSCHLPLTEAEVTWLGANSLDDAGVSVGTAGDINGDGFDDYLIGARHSDRVESDAGAAYLAFGPVTAGDVLELGVTGTVFEGIDGGDKLGRAVAGGEDLDDDGVPDVVVSAPSDEEGASAAGAVYLFSGAGIGTSGKISAADADSTWLGESSYDYLGIEVAVADLTDDGVADLLFGASGDDAGASDAGAIYVFAAPLPAGLLDLGPDKDWTAKVTGESDSDGVGQVFDASGDFDGDGSRDLVVGVPKDATVGVVGGAAYLVLGPLDGDISLADADVKLLAATENDQVGSAVAFLGDQDDDGADELAVGANLEDTVGADAGAVYLLAGTTAATALDGSDITAVADSIIYGEDSGDQLGEALAGDGDFDGDGRFDLLVGAPSGGSVGQGLTYVFLSPLGAGTTLTDALAVVEGETSGDNAGGVLGFAGDTNATGRDVLMVSARNSDRGGTDAGAVYMLLEIGL